MASFKLPTSMIALLKLFLVLVVLTSATALTPAHTGDLSVANATSPPIITTCSTIPGISSSAVVGGRTFSIPLDYYDCAEADHYCWEAGRLCGYVEHVIVTVTTMVTKTTTAETATKTATQTFFETATKTVTVEANTATDVAATGLADSGAFAAFFAALLGVAALVVLV